MRSIEPEIHLTIGAGGEMDSGLAPSARPGMTKDGWTSFLKFKPNDAPCSAI
jgi:hypothetical protein